MGVRSAALLIAAGLFAAGSIACTNNARQVITVPNVEGLQLRDAIVQLEQMRLTVLPDGNCLRTFRLLKARDEAERRAARGEKRISVGGGLGPIEVVHQAPPPGTLVVRGARVDLQERCAILG